MLKSLLILLVLVVLTAGGFFLYKNLQTKPNLQSLVSPKPIEKPQEQPKKEAPSQAFFEEAGDWKMYRNSNFKYVIKYPKDWSLTEAKPRVGNEPVWLGTILIDKELQKVTFAEKESKLWPGEFQVRVLSNPDQVTLDQWAKNYKEESAAGANLARLTGDTTLAGDLAKKFSIFSFDRYEVAIVTIHNGNVYYLRFDSDNPNDPDFGEHREIYNQMVASFKLLN
jgi:hypothetical protein